MCIPEMTFDTAASAPIKVCTDASIRDGLASVGIIVKNHNGKILERHQRLIGSGYEVAEAEAMAIHEATEKITADHAIFHTDCPHIFEWGPTDPVPYGEDCRHRLDPPGDVTISFDGFETAKVKVISREQNFDAHLYANAAFDGLPG